MHGDDGITRAEEANARYGGGVLQELKDLEGLLNLGGLNAYAVECHLANAKWWTTPEGTRLVRNKGELLMLIVSEIAEAMEGERKDLMDDKLPHRKMVEVELADALIRIFDYAGAHGYDLQGAYEEKMAFNAVRADHTYEARAQAGGKQF